jgi:hypothetical protein
MNFPRHIKKSQYLKNCKRAFGSENPTRFDNSVWDWMIRTESNPYSARVELGVKPNYDPIGNPDFCFRRLGMTHTKLSDGRTVYIAGEHEDWYDPDFCIYNDIVVVRNFRSARCDDDGYVEYGEDENDNSNACVEHFGYPCDVFPPTDFHTATLIGDQIYIVGSLGYPDTRRGGYTQVFSLCTKTYTMRQVDTSGDNPGWLSHHNAKLLDDQSTIRVWGGEVWSRLGDKEELVSLLSVFDLDTRSGLWTRAEDNADWMIYEIEYKLIGQDEPNKSISDDTESCMPIPWLDQCSLLELGFLYGGQDGHRELLLGHNSFWKQIDDVDVECSCGLGSIKLLVKGRIQQHALDNLVDDIHKLLKRSRFGVVCIKVQPKG